MSHRDLTAQVRSEIKNAGIKAGVRLYKSCGSNWVQVNVPAYEIDFTEDEQRMIRTIAKSLGLTLARGMEIDPEQMTGPKSLNFVAPGTW
jgi:hypothetical protein